MEQEIQIEVENKVKPKLVPKLRYNEFEEEWKSLKLIALSTNGFSNGAFNDPKKVGSGYRIINVLDMYIDGPIQVDTLKRVALDDKEYSKNRVEYGDVFFTRSSLVKEGIAFSNVNLTEENDLTFDGHLIRMRPNIEEYLPKYLYYTFKTSGSRKQFIVRGKTATMTTIGQEDIADVQVPFPTLPEQQKIASFLSVVDKKIQQLTRKKELLEIFKKGVMQKLFSHELRFKDEDGNDFPEWEVKKLEEVGEIITGSTPPTTNLSYYNGNRFFVSPADITGGRYVKETKTMVSEKGLKKGRLVEKGAVLFVCIGSTIGKVAQAREDCITNQQINSIIPLKDNSSDFIYSLLNFYGGKIKLLAGVQAVPQINKSDFSKIEFALPVLPEQQKIADFLSGIDLKIEAVSQQITQTQSFKKGLLQQMFV